MNARKSNESLDLSSPFGGQGAEAIILAGGLGTRLRETVPDLPKCMALVADRPFLSFVIDALRMQGIKKFVFALGYKADVVLQYLATAYPTLNYSSVIESEPLGTGGAIQFAIKKITCHSVLVANGDTLFKINLASISQLHFQNKAECTLALKTMQNFDRYGVVEMNELAQIISFKEKQFYKEGLMILARSKERLQIDGGEARRLKADLLSGIAFVELKTGLYSEAITNLEAALAELDDSTLDNYSRVFILNDFGHLLNEQRSHRQAVNYLEKAAQIWQQQKDWRNFAMAQQNLAVAFRGTGDFKQAQFYFESVRALAVKNNFSDLETMSLQGLASLHQYRGENRQAVEILQKVLVQTSASVRRAEILWRLSTS